MSWQDLILTIGSLIFIVSLLPMLFTSSKPPRFTALTTGTTLLAFAGVYASKSLPFACVTTALSAAIWLGIGLQITLSDKHLTAL